MNALLRYLRDFVYSWRTLAWASTSARRHCGATIDFKWNLSVPWDSLLHSFNHIHPRQRTRDADAADEGRQGGLELTRGSHSRIMHDARGVNRDDRAILA